MANLAGDLSKQIFGHSDAEQTFRPWWVVLEDYIMYSMVLMGAITLPMTFLTGTPLECVIHPDLWHVSQLTPGDITTTSSSEAIASASAKNLRSLMNSLNPSHADAFMPKLNSQSINVRRIALYLRSFAKKYCAENYVSPFVLYLPFCLFLTPILLVLVEKAFSTVFSTERRQNVLYNSLLKSSLEREDVQELERETARKSFEVYQNLRKSQSLYKAHYWKGWASLCIILCLLVFYSTFEKDVTMSQISCRIHQVPFICVVSNTKFFRVIFNLAYMQIVVYLVLATYNVIWFHNLNYPKLSNILSGLIQIDKHSKRKNLGTLEAMMKIFTRKNKRSFHVPEVRLDLYYNEDAKDFRLMMNLFAEQSSASIAHALRILTLFDKHFQRLWKPTDFLVQKRSLCENKRTNMNMGPTTKVGIHLLDDNEMVSFLPEERNDTGGDRVEVIPMTEEEDEESNGEGGEATDDGDIKRLCVLFNDAPIAAYMSEKLPKVIFEYTVEIYPSNLVETPVKSVKYHKVPDLDNNNHGGFQQRGGDLDEEDTAALLCKCAAAAAVPGSSAAGDRLQRLHSVQPLNSKQKYALWFDGFVDMSNDDGFHVTVSTELGGVTVAQVILRDTLREDAKKDKSKQLDGKTPSRSNNKDNEALLIKKPKKLQSSPNI